MATPNFLGLKPIIENGRKLPKTKTLLSHTPNRVTVVTVIVIRRIDIRGIDVEVVHIVAIVVRRRPEVAVRPLIVRRAIVEVARKRSRQGRAETGVKSHTAGQTTMATKATHVRLK